MTNKLWLIWKEPNSRRRYMVGILEQKDNKYFFRYTNPELEDAVKVGFKYFPGFDDLKKEYINDKLFYNIETRLPNSTRVDYLEILNSYELKKDSKPMEILKITKGRLLTDNYEFVPVFDEKDKIEFEIAGTKYYDSKEIKEKIKLEENLYLISEPNNIEDENAIKIICKVDNQEKLLGYVPRYYAKSLTELLNKNIKYSAKIRKLRLESPLDDENISVTVKLIFDIN